MKYARYDQESSGQDRKNAKKVQGKDKVAGK